MKQPARAPRVRPRAKPVLPKAVTDRTDQLVQISDHCAAAKEIAEGLGETFLAYLLAMVIHETAATMRRATAGAPPPSRKSVRKTTSS